MDKKIGVYICTGCKIADYLDVDKLAEVATGEYKVAVCKTHPFFCGKEGAQLIEKDIEDGVNTVVIAACSPRVNWDVFCYDPNVILERINIREHVVWSVINVDVIFSAVAPPSFSIVTIRSASSPGSSIPLPLLSFTTLTSW